MYCNHSTKKTSMFVLLSKKTRYKDCFGGNSIEFPSERFISKTVVAMKTGFAVNITHKIDCNFTQNKFNGYCRFKKKL